MALVLGLVVEPWPPTTDHPKPEFLTNNIPPIHLSTRISPQKVSERLGSVDDYNPNIPRLELGYTDPIN